MKSCWINRNTLLMNISIYFSWKDKYFPKVITYFHEIKWKDIYIDIGVSCKVKNIHKNLYIFYIFMTLIHFNACTVKEKRKRRKLRILSGLEIWNLSFFNIFCFIWSILGGMIIFDFAVNFKLFYFSLLFNVGIILPAVLHLDLKK